MHRYGQELHDPNVPLPVNPDGRGVIPKHEAQAIRDLRAQEAWERYDSIVIGQNASNLSRGWFNSWAGFAGADRLAWFSGRDTNVGPAYTNQSSEREDWAMDIYNISVQLIPPPGLADLESDNGDAQNIPIMFATQLANMLALRVVLAESDEIAKAPADHFPAGYGVSYPLVSAAAAPTVIAGNNGEPVVQNTWKFVEPVMLAAKAKITITGQVDQPIRNMFAAITGPGTKLFPAAAGGVHAMPNFYQIKITLRGPRYLQLRGARSSA
jgi:hypothetical protein